MRMARLPHLAILSFAAAVHLLLVSICPSVSGRIYRTKDAIVIEVDDTMRFSDTENQPLTRLARSHSGNPPPIAMTSAGSANPYGLYYQQQPNFPFLPYPLLYEPASSFSDVENVTATSPESRQTMACGVGPDSPPQRGADRIVGGTVAKPNSWPFVVGLKTSTAFLIFCGGSIISPTKILTAATCVERLSLKQISTMTVRLGMSDQGDGKDLQHDAPVTRRVSRAVYHIDYNRKTKQNDIAVLTVDPPIVYSKSVSPVCLPPANSAPSLYAGKNAAILGWGKTAAAGGSVARFLQQAGVNIMTNAVCKLSWSDVADIFARQLCAIGDGKDICTGDNGGPLVAQLKDGSTSWTQIGVASFSDACSGERPTVFTSVAFFRNWINTNLNS